MGDLPRAMGDDQKSWREEIDCNNDPCTRTVCEQLKKNRGANMVVLGAWCVSFCSWGWVTSIAVFQEYYQTNLLKQYSAAEIAWIPSLQIFFQQVTAPLIGWIFDRYGPKYLLFSGSFLHVFGLMMTSISTKYYQVMLAQGVCSGIGAAIIYLPALIAVGGWFEERRATAFGVLTTGSGLGGVLFPIIVTRLIRGVGFGWALRISAFIIFFLLAIANLTVKCRSPPTPRPLSRQELIAPFKELDTVLVCVGFMLLTFGIFVPVNYITVQARMAGMSLALSNYLPSIYNGVSIFGRFFAGLTGDRMGRFNTYIVVCYLSGIMVLALWLPATSNGEIIVFASIFGITSGAYVSLSLALIVQVSRSKEFGYRMGLLFFFACFPGLTTNPIAGAILEQNHNSFVGVQIYSGVMWIAGTTLVVAARFWNTGPRFLVKF